MSQLRALVIVCVVSVGCGPLNPPEGVLPGGSGGGSAGKAGGEGGGGAAVDAGGGGAGGSGGMGGGGAAGIVVSFATDVMPVLKTKCAGCHSGQYEQAAVTFMRLRANTSATAACANAPRIEVNNGANSLLVKKLLGTAGCGAVMPLIKVGTTMVACAGAECVAPADIEKVKLWIDQGAVDN